MNTENKIVKGQICIAGDVDISGYQGSVDTYQFALLIKFDTAEELRKALADGKIEISF